MVLGLVTVATSMSLGLVVVVSLGPLNVLIVIGGFLKMSLMDRITPTRVVIRIAVPRMDLGVIPLTLKFDGNTATCRDVLQEVTLFKNTALHEIKKWFVGNWENHVGACPRHPAQEVIW